MEIIDTISEQGESTFFAQKELLFNQFNKDKAVYL